MDLQAIFGDAAAIDVVIDGGDHHGGDEPLLGWTEWTEERAGRRWRVIQRDGEEVFPWSDWSLQDDHVPPIPKAGICRCRSTETVDVPIHDGASVRRDCARCGRFICWPIWHGEPVS